MKKSVWFAIIPVFLAISALAVNAQQKKSPLSTVPGVDLKRYAGKWFEIARYPNKFQEKCVGNTTATYTIKENNKLEVLNECLKKDGIADSAKGEAKIVDTQTNAKFEVRFAPSFLSALPQVWGDYWIIDLDENYTYAVVGDPKRKYLWILSRTAEMKDTTYQNILRRVEKMGFSPGKLNKTPQNAEAVKGAVVDKQ